MSKKTLRTTAGAALAAAMMLGSGAAVAQGVPQQAQPQQPQQAQPQIEPVTDAEISQFVAANDAVSEIAEEVTPKLESAGDQESAQAIQAEAQEKMITAISEEGLSPERFTQIAQLAQMDQELATKLRAEMDS